MKAVRPVHAAVLILFLAATVLVADFALDGGFSRAAYQRVSPDPEGRVILDVSDIGAGEVRFYQFLNFGNQEVRFFVGRDLLGHAQVAFDANGICFKTKRGFRQEDDWVVCNKCDKAFELAEVNAGGGGCKPVPLAHRLEGDRLVLSEGDILTGWRYFR